MLLAPLMRLAGFYRYPIQINVEEDIALINIEDEDTKITARLDILAINKIIKLTDKTFFWVLLIESKNSSISHSGRFTEATNIRI